MTLISGEALDEIFTRIESTADHLEVRDRYQDPVEDEALRRYLAGKPDDLEWMKPWLDQVRALTAERKRFRRLRVVTLPLSDYQRWGLLRMSHLNIAAGEDIRYLDRAEASDLPALDYWLFDVGTATAQGVEVLFDDADEFTGGRLFDEAQITDLATGFDRAFASAVPAQTFTEAHRLG